MTAWTSVAVSLLATGKKLPASRLLAIYNNITALAEGSAGAPRISPAAFAVAPEGVDGSASAVPTVNGIYRYTDLTDNTGGTMGAMTWLLVKGDVDLSNAVINAGTFPSSAGLPSLLETLDLERYRAFWNTKMDAQAASGGGGSVGNGGSETNGFGTGNVANFWRLLRLIVGGSGSDSGGTLRTKGGGGLGIIADGDINLTNATIRCDGANGGSSSYSGAGGGSLIFIGTGTITETGATLAAAGGNANGSGNGSGGGGGYLARVATAFTGTATTDVGGGTKDGIGTVGADGLNEGQITPSEANLRSIVNGILAG